MSNNIDIKWVYDISQKRYYTYEEMFDKREDDLYKDTILRMFQKKDYDYSGFDEFKELYLDNPDKLFRYDWNDIKHEMDYPFREDVEKYDEIKQLDEDYTSSEDIDSIPDVIKADIDRDVK